MVTVAAGARITGSFGFEEFGAGLAVGDFNGDGVADLAVNYRIIGSTREDSASTVQIIFGGDGVLEGSLDAALLAGGRVTTSGLTDIGVGIDVPGPLSISDVNDDGLADLLIGAPRARSDAPSTGGAGYILFGVEGDAAFDFGLSNLTNGTDGQAFFATGGLNAGSSIINLGDVDGDDVDELFVGVPFAPAPEGSPSSGLGFVVERGADAITDLAGAFRDPPAPEATILFSSERAFIAEDAAALGDVNGDDIADFLITGSGAIGAGVGLFSGNNGEAYLIYGQQGGLPDRIDVTQLDGAIGTQILATDIFQIANRAEAAGDVNGDGLADFLLIDAGPATDEPLVYLVYGQEGGLSASFDLSTSDGVSKLGGVPSAGNANGVDVAGIGDVNGDGFGEILVGRAGGGPNGAGEITLVFGAEAGVGDTVDLDNLADGAGYRFVAAENEFGAGFAVTGSGDLNDDGLNDFVIGAPFFNPDSNAEFDFDAPGAAFIVFGGADRLAALDAVDGEDGVIALANVAEDIDLPGGPQPITYNLGADFTVAERNGEDTTFAISITRTDGTGVAEVALTASGAATATGANADFTQIGGSGRFDAGETETSLLFRLTDDLAVEFAEDLIFDLSLVGAEAPSVIGDGQQVVTITDDDEISFFNLGPDFTVAERNGEDVTFAATVTRSFGAGVAEIALATSGAGAGDVTVVPTFGANVFAAGETETQVVFRLIDDLQVEFAEDLILDLSVVSSDAAAEVVDGQQIITINDDDQLSFFSLGDDFSIAERNGQETSFGVTVTRTVAIGEAEISLATSGPGATDAFRFLGENTFADGETETRAIFRLIDDRVVEPTEEFIVDLSIVSSDAPAEVTDGRQVISILDDDTPVVFSLDPDLSFTEGTGRGAQINTFVSRSSGEGEAVVNITLGGSATAIGPSRDYELLTPSVTFADGETLKQVSLILIADAVDEPDETISLGINVISSVGVAIVEDGQQIITIEDDDDPAPVIGSDQDDSLVGGAEGDQISGREGRDTIFGAGGDDFLVGGSGADRLFGGFGDDTLSAGTGDDLVLGGRGDDRLNGQSGDDTLRGGDGDDSLIAGRGDDLATGGAGDDAISGGLGDDRLEGEAGADRLFGGNGSDTLFGGSGVDRLEGGDDRDFIFGNSGNDTIRGDSGDDILSGGSGEDLIFGGDGADVLRGGGGADRLSGGAGDDATFGQAGDDRIIGGAGNDTLNGGGGADRIMGGSGRDRLLGESGSDTLIGGSGDDFIRGGAERDFLSGGGGRDLLSGESGSDFLTGNNGADTILGGTGRDTIIGGRGDDILNGGGGRDLFVFAANSGSDLVQDFRDGVDRIEIVGGPATFSELQISERSGNAVVSFGAAEVELNRFDSALLDGSDFIFS